MFGLAGKPDCQCVLGKHLSAAKCTSSDTDSCVHEACTYSKVDCGLWGYGVVHAAKRLASSTNEGTFLAVITIGPEMRSAGVSTTELVLNRSVYNSTKSFQIQDSIVWSRLTIDCGEAISP